MHFLKETIKKSNGYVWYIATFISLVLLALVLSQIDFTQLITILDSVSWTIFTIAILVLLLEGLFTALRIKLFTPGKPALKSCLEITAWFIVSLIILPARLGEIAVILLLKEKLNQSTGASIMNFLTQRFIDLMFLCAMLLIFVLLNKSIEHVYILYINIFAIMFFLFVSLYKLDSLLGFIASLFYLKKRRPKNSILLILFRMSLQARIWYRFHINNYIFSKAILASICKWASNIGGLTLLFYSINIPLNEIQLMLASTAYNFLAIIPLQTIGGIGISEAGLTGIFLFFGLSITFAASVSVMIRLVLISTPFLFFLLIYSYYSVVKNGK